MANLVELGFARGTLDSICVGSNGILQVLVVWKISPSNSELGVSGFQIWSLMASHSLMESVLLIGELSLYRRCFLGSEILGDFAKIFYQKYKIIPFLGLKENF